MCTKFFKSSDWTWSKFPWIKGECDFISYYLRKTWNLWITISPCYQEFEWKTSQFKCAFTWKAILWNAKNCFQAFFRECEFNHLSTMLQKLSKCEVKAWLCWNLIIYRHYDFMWNPILVDSIGPKMSFLPILETLNFKFLLNLGLDSCSNLLKSRFRTSKIGKYDIFGPFEFTKIWFHVKSEWR